MRSPIFLTALFGAVAHAQWEVRADFSRCGVTGYEAALDGQTATVAGDGIFDFLDITAPFSGNLVVKPVNSVGFGSPYPVDRVYVELSEGADAGGVFGTATFEPGVEVLQPALVAWYTTPGLNAFSTQKIDSAALQRNETVSVGTTTDKSRLRVYYCSFPTTA